MSRSEVDFDTIEVAADGRRGTIALNRPNHLNPLSSHTLRENAQAALCDLGIPLAWGGIPHLDGEIGPALIEELVF